MGCCSAIIGKSSNRFLKQQSQKKKKVKIPNLNLFLHPQNLILNVQENKFFLQSFQQAIGSKTQVAIGHFTNNSIAIAGGLLNQQPTKEFYLIHCRQQSVAQLYPLPVNAFSGLIYMYKNSLFVVGSLLEPEKSLPIICYNLQSDRWLTNVRLEIQGTECEDIRNYLNYGSCQIKKFIYLIGGQRKKSKNSKLKANDRIVKYSCHSKIYSVLKIQSSLLLLNPVLIGIDRREILITSGISFFSRVANRNVIQISLKDGNYKNLEDFPVSLASRSIGFNIEGNLLISSQENVYIKPQGCQQWISFQKNMKQLPSNQINALQITGRSNNGNIQEDLSDLIQILFSSEKKELFSQKIMQEQKQIQKQVQKPKRRKKKKNTHSQKKIRESSPSQSPSISGRHLKKKYEPSQKSSNSKPRKKEKKSNHLTNPPQISRKLKKKKVIQIQQQSVSDLQQQCPPNMFLQEKVQHLKILLTQPQSPKINQKLIQETPQFILRSEEHSVHRRNNPTFGIPNYQDIIPAQFIPLQTNENINPEDQFQEKLLFSPIRKSETQILPTFPVLRVEIQSSNAKQKEDFSLDQKIIEDIHITSLSADSDLIPQRDISSMSQYSPIMSLSRNLDGKKRKNIQNKEEPDFSSFYSQSQDYHQFRSPFEETIQFTKNITQIQINSNQPVFYKTAPQLGSYSPTCKLSNTIDKSHHQKFQSLVDIWREEESDLQEEQPEILLTHPSAQQSESSQSSDFLGENKNDHSIRLSSHQAVIFLKIVFENFRISGFDIQQLFNLVGAGEKMSFNLNQVKKVLCIIIQENRYKIQSLIELNQKIHRVIGAKPFDSREVWKPISSIDINGDYVYVSKEQTIEILRRSIKYLVTKKF